MVYELWDMVSYGEGEPLVPFTLLESHEDFGVVYGQFTETIKKKMSVIFIRKKDE